MEEEIPKYHKRATASKHKRFGIQETYNTWIGGRWVSTKWFLTKRARDQSYDDLLKKTTGLRKYLVESETKKVER